MTSNSLFDCLIKLQLYQTQMVNEFFLSNAGIPPVDLKEHERQRQGGRGSGSDDDDEPSAKKMKPEGLLGSAPAAAMMQAAAAAAGMPAGMMPPGMMPPGLHGMPPGLSMGPVMQMNPMAPPFLHPGYV